MADLSEPGGVATADTLTAEQTGELPDAPDFARLIPVSIIDQEKNQQAADEWGQAQQARIADMWGNWQQQRLDTLIAHYQNGPQFGPPQPVAYTPTIEPAGDQQPQDQGINPVTAEPVQNPVVEQLMAGLGGLVDRLKQSGQTGEAAPPLEGGALGIGAHALQGPALPEGAAQGDIAGDVAQSAVGQGVQGALEHGAATRDALTALPDESGQLVSRTGKVYTPEEQNQAIADMTAGAMSGDVVAAKAAGKVAAIAREALTADHPIVQAVAKASEVNGAPVAPEAVAKVIQAPGFNPVNLAKAGSRRNPVQTAALTAYRAANDADLANGLIAAARDATGAAEPTAEQIWDSVPGIGNHAAEPLPTPASTEPGIDSLAQAGKEPPSSGSGGKAPPVGSSSSFGDTWRAVNRGIVQAKLMNPLIHTWNLLSETLSQYADPRQLAGIVGDFKTAENAMRDPNIAARLVDESAGRLNLPSMRAYADDIGTAVGGGLKNAPVIGGVKNAYDALTAFNHKMLFENLGQRLQIASYEGAKRMGMDPEAAAAYANAKFGQIGSADRNQLMQWVGDNVAFAGKWLQGTGIQLGSLIGQPGFGGYAATLSDAQKAQLAAGLRGDFLKGIGMLVGSHAIINHQLSGQWPWKNEDGRWLDINTGQQDNQGKTIYVPDPFFRRVQDAAHLLAVPVPGNPAMQAMGTTTTSALASKAAPLIGTAADIASGSQYLAPVDQPPGVTGGPPIVAPNSDTGDLAKQMGAFAFNQVSPVQVKYSAAARSAEGIKLAQPQLGFDVGPGGSKAGVAAGVAGALTGANAVTGPRDIGTKNEYFQHQEDAAYGPSAAPFRAAGIQLSTMPNQFSAGTGSKKVDVPTTPADKPVFQQAYKQVLDAGLQQYQGKTNKAVLTAIEQKAFSAGKNAVEKTLTKDEVARRMGVAVGADAGATAFWKSGEPAASVPSSSVARPASSGSATAFWKKAS